METYLNIEPLITQFLSAANSWLAAVNGAEELILTVGSKTPVELWGQQSSYSQYPVSNNYGHIHYHVWVGATYNIPGDLTGLPYVVSAVILDYPVALDAISIEDIYGIAGSITMRYLSTSDVNCTAIVSENVWPSKRLNASANLSIYVKYLGLHYTPYKNRDFSSSSWFTPSLLSTFPTLSGPLGVRDLRARYSTFSGYPGQNIICSSPNVYDSIVSIPYFIPFTNSDVVNTILADLAGAAESPENPHYDANVRFLRVLVVSNHLVDMALPTGDESMALYHNSFLLSYECGVHIWGEPPVLLYKPTGVTGSFVYYYSIPSPGVAASRYEFPPGSDYEKAVMETTYLADTSVGAVRSDVFYSEGRGFVQPTGGGAFIAGEGPGDYGDHLIAPVSERPMVMPRLPSSYWTIAEAETSETHFLSDSPSCKRGWGVGLGWSFPNAPSQTFPYRGYFTAFPSVGAFLEAAIGPYQLYQAPPLDLSKPSGATLAVSLGAVDAGSTVHVWAANPALVWEVS